jgi:hypothetical protein
MTVFFDFARQQGAWANIPPKRKRNVPSGLMPT